jgi:hypothetical protein
MAVPRTGLAALHLGMFTDVTPENTLLRDKYVTHLFPLSFIYTVEEVAEIWRKMHNKELHTLFSSPNVISITTLRRMRWVGSCNKHGGDERYV